MKILISAGHGGGDRRHPGLPFDVEPGTEQWQRCRRMFTSDVNAAVAWPFLDGGANAPCSSTRRMRPCGTCCSRSLDDRAVMLTGLRDKDLSMVEGIQYGDVDRRRGVRRLSRGRAGAEGVLAHTYLANSITAVRVNGAPASEGLADRARCRAVRRAGGADHRRRPCLRAPTPPTLATRRRRQTVAGQGLRGAGTQPCAGLPTITAGQIRKAAAEAAQLARRQGAGCQHRRCVIRDRGRRRAAGPGGSHRPGVAADRRADGRVPQRLRRTEHHPDFKVVCTMISSAIRGRAWLTRSWPAARGRPGRRDGMAADEVIADRIGPHQV